MEKFENYPSRIVILSNAASLAIYGLGFYIIFHLSLLIAVLYLLYVLALEVRLIKTHCVNCYYYGKSCGFGKGRVSSWFFKKGEATKFCADKFTWKDMIPDLLVSFIPVIIWIVLLILKFEFSLLIAGILLIFLSTSGNGYIRGSLTCKFCKQRDLGCPANDLFNKQNQK